MQKYSSIKTTNARPNQRTNLVASGGQNWSLSSLSNVPYVRFTGPGGFQKEFSWGEIVELPPGVDAFVENASYHPGDIILNGGTDYANLPSRITVPVNMTNGVGGPVITEAPAAPFTAATQFRADVRRARRAYFAIIITSLDISIGFSILGYAESRSHTTFNGIPLSGDSRGGVGYISPYIQGANTVGAIVPLGYGTVFGLPPGEPHALLDSAEVQFQITDFEEYIWLNLSTYFIMEY